MDRKADEIIQSISKEQREWFRQRYSELRNQYSRYYLEQVSLGRMSRDESIRKCGQAIINALKMELSLRK